MPLNTRKASKDTEDDENIVTRDYAFMRLEHLESTDLVGVSEQDVEALAHEFHSAQKYVLARTPTADRKAEFQHTINFDYKVQSIKARLKLVTDIEQTVSIENVIPSNFKITSISIQETPNELLNVATENWVLLDSPNGTQSIFRPQNLVLDDDLTNNVQQNEKPRRLNSSGEDPQNLVLDDDLTNNVQQNEKSLRLNLSGEELAPVGPADDSGSEEEDDDELRALLEDEDDANDYSDVAEDQAEDIDETFSWSEDYSAFSGQEEVYTEIPGPKVNETNPFDLFIKIWDRTIMEHIVEEKNRYAWETIATATEKPDGGISSYSRLNAWVETSVEELYRLFAVIILMGCCVRGTAHEYWTTGVLGMPKFRQLMTRNRYFLLMRFLHFTDNNCLTNNIRGQQRKGDKIKSVLDHCNAKFAELYTPHREMCIDESLLLFKGRLNLIQCMRTKATRFGITFYDLCEACTGYVVKFIMYTGKGCFSSEPLYGFVESTAKMVLRLMQGYLEKGHLLVMDKLFNSIALTRFMKSHKTDIIGTLNRKRTDTPLMVKNINDKRCPRGHVVSRHCGDVSVLAWNDVKLVTTVSTYHKPDMVPEQRFGQVFLKPKMVEDYNKYMAAADRKEQKLSMYFLERKRGIKWYIKVFKRLLNTSILNVYIIHCANSKVNKEGIDGQQTLSLRQFRMQLVDLLAQQHPILEKPRSGSAVTPISDSLRLDGVSDHFPIHGEVNNGRKTCGNKVKRRKCVRCSAKGRRRDVSFRCQKCDVYLCIGKCWIEYHTLKTLFS